MVTKLIPAANTVYFINTYTMMHIMEGTGSIQVDFKSFYDWEDKLIFLEKGQYIKFLSDDFIVRKVEFEDEEIFRSKDFRVLFKHLVSLGYINFDECEQCQQYLENAIFSKPSDILDISAQQWYWQNPFHANTEEYHVIFDVKDVVDSQFRNHLTNEEIVRLIGQYDVNPQVVYTQKVGLTIKKLWNEKRLLESKKEIAFTDKSMKEIASDLGYKDTAYFNRTFKEQTGSTPLEFREHVEFEGRDSFVQHLYELVHEYHVEQRKLDFYADKMNLSVKTLSRKVSEKLQISLGQLLRRELIASAKKHIENNVPINEIAWLLRFEESNHFSAFFKHYTGITPSEYQKQKVQ